MGLGFAFVVVAKEVTEAVDGEALELGGQALGAGAASRRLDGDDDVAELDALLPPDRPRFRQLLQVEA